MSSVPIAFIVGNDKSAYEPLELCISTAGWRSETFASAEDFLAYPRVRIPSCLVLDVPLPGLNSIELQKRIVAERPEVPIIFLTDHADIRMAVAAMKLGALEFLTKPFEAEALLHSIRYAIARSKVALDRESEMHELRADFGSLTRREREVMTLVVSGLMNKQVGGELGISEITVKAHRGNVMRKMKATSFAELVKMAARLRVARPLATSAA